MSKKKLDELIAEDSWRQLFDSSASEVKQLVILAESKGQPADRARIILSGLKQEDARYALCQLAMQEERPWLNELLATTSYLPAEKKMYSAFFVISKQWDKYLHHYNKSGHGELFEHIATPSDVSERILEQIEKTDDPSCVRFVLDLLFDKDIARASFTTRAGKISQLENRLLVVLAHLQDIGCQRLVYLRWFQTRDQRLDDLISKYQIFDFDNLEHKLYAHVKFGEFARKKPEEYSKSALKFLLSLNAENVSILLRAAGDVDPTIGRSARGLITQLKSAESRQQVLSMLLGQQESTAAELQILERLAPKLHYAPEEKEDLVLFKLLLRDWDAFVKLDPESKITQRIYQWANLSLRQRIASALKESSRFEWIVNVCGPEGKIKLSEMTHDDWQLLQKSLSSTSSWDEIWKLIPLMPPANAKKFLHRLQQVSWKPKEAAEKERFERLVSFASRLSTDHPPLWSDAILWKTIDIGGNLFDQIHGGLEMWESRFSFSFDGSEFYMLDKHNEVLSWALPSCLPGRVHLDTEGELSAIAASPNSPMLAIGKLGGNVQICDLESRRLTRHLVHECKPGEDGPTRIKNLSFSENGAYLMAVLRSPGRSLCCNTISYQTDQWKKTAALPPYAHISSDNQWLLYPEFNQVHLEKMDGKRSRVASIPTSFRSGTLHFLPDGSGIIRDDGRLSLHSLPGLVRMQQVYAPGTVPRSFIVSEQNKYRILGLVEPDYKWVFLDCPNKDQINQTEQRVVVGRYPPWQRAETAPQRQSLMAAGVDINPVNDFSGPATPYTVCQILKDPDSQYLAVVHSTGKVSFWVSALFRYAQSSTALMTDTEREELQARLHSASSSETELNWLKFIFELSGTYEHCAIAIAETGNNYVELSKFDIEIV